MPSQPSPQPLRRLATLALLLLLVPFAQRAAIAQQTWVQGSPYVQANPNYVQYQQPPAQAYPRPYAQQPQYSQQQPYPQQQPYADPGQDDTQQAYTPPPQQGGQPFVAEQLEQLVAPIALYPDALIAQILAASTYPAQVAAADNWMRGQGYASPDQIAYGADAQTGWDPSVKALTAFPQVLDMMNRDLRWTTDLGNAYYNQPQDVLQTIQVMRQRAEDAGSLRSTPQEAITYEQGYIQLAPPNPQVVYVPTYDPWTVYGQPVQPYPGFSFGDALGAIGSVLGDGLRYGAGIGMAAFSHTPFGWAGWLLNWLTSSIFFHQSPYYSQSTSVAHWGNGRGGYYGSQTAGINRTPNGYNRPQQGYNRFGNQPAAPAFTRPPLRMPENYAYNHGYSQGAEAPNRGYAGSYVRPALRDNTYNRPQSPVVQPARPQTYARSGGYGNGFYSNSQQAYAARPAAPYAGQQSWRAPASTYERNDFAQHSYAEPRTYGGERGYEQSYARQEHSGGMHMFGGHSEERFHESYKAPKMPKAPKAPKMSGGGGHHGGGGLFHHGR